MLVEIAGMFRPQTATTILFFLKNGAREKEEEKKKYVGRSFSNTKVVRVKKGVLKRAIHCIRRHELQMLRINEVVYGAFSEGINSKDSCDIQAKYLHGVSK
jgi:hypothetical protein